MSTVNLLDLPNLVLAKILSHIPDHFEVSTICQKFYEIDCYNSKKDSNILLRCQTFEFNDEEFLRLRSILSSKRTIRSMDFRLSFNEPGQVELAKKISKLHGHSVKELKLQTSWIQNADEQPTEATLVQLLNCFPNLEELHMELDDVNLVKGDSEVLKLQKLVKLEICLKSSLFFTNRLPENLRKIEIKAKASGRKISPELIEKLKSLKLEELAFGSEREIPINLAELKGLLEAQQNSLKFLSLSDLFQNFEPEFFRELKNMKILESLNIGNMTGFSAEAFSKMTKLKRLEIGYSDDLEEISLVKTVPVEELMIRVSLLPHILQQFGQNYPIKILKLTRVHENLKFFMENFPHLESLELTFESFAKTAFIYESDGIDYPNLKMLKVVYYSNVKVTNFFSESSRVFPNLEELHFFVGFQISASFLDDLKNSFGRLKKLIMLSSISDLEHLNSEESIKTLQQLSKTLESAFFFLEMTELTEINRYLDKLRGYYRIQQTVTGLTLRKLYL